MHETQARSFLKTIAWRIIATLVTGGVFYAFTGRLGESTAYALIAGVINLFAYYAHERVWNSIRWGKRG